MNPTTWAVILLNMLGYGTDQNLVNAMVSWEQAEGGWWNNSATFNPLNTTQPMPGSHSMNGAGVQAYTTEEQGLEATIKTLRNGNYGDILSALQGQDGGALAQAVVNSPWGTQSISFGGQNYTKSATAGGGGGSSTTNSGSMIQQQAAKLDAKTLAEEYGFTDSFLNANPELKKIFGKAVQQQWSTDKFKAALMGTKWWIGHDQTERQYLTQVATDPATARQTYAQAQVHAQQLMAQLGVNLAHGQYSSVLSTLAYNIAAKGWNDEQAKYFAGQYVNLINGKMSGDAETNYSNGLQYAYSMGVKMSDSWYQGQIQSIERGTSTFADLQTGIRDQAKAQFSQFSQQIDAGQTMQDLASPYISQMGQILEVNPQALSAFDPTIKKALTYKDPTTGAVGSQPLWQFENTLRQDPRWLQTNNARDTMMTTAHGVLQSFGFVS